MCFKIIEKLIWSEYTCKKHLDSKKFMNLRSIHCPQIFRSKGVRLTMHHQTQFFRWSYELSLMNQRSQLLELSLDPELHLISNFQVILLNQLKRIMKNRNISTKIYNVTHQFSNTTGGIHKYILSDINPYVHQLLKDISILDKIQSNQS